MPRLCSSLLLSLLIASSASAVTLGLTPIGDPGNACDPQQFSIGVTNPCSGGVNYAYHIGTYEVTNAQYAEFLNAKAASDPLGLYNTGMANSSFSGNGGITRTGISGSYTYSAIAGRANMPVNYVSAYDAMRFANWMNNGQGSSDTESGSYLLLGGTATPSNGTTVTRSAGAQFVLPSNDEWYKAAYYAPSTLSYFDYPTGTDALPTCTTPTATANRANCDPPGPPMATVVPVGSYLGSPSPYGTFDQGGNVYEWSQAIPIPNGTVQSACGLDPGVCREKYGGSFAPPSSYLVAGAAWVGFAASDYVDTGFRLAYIPEPSTGLLVIAGLLGFAARRRTRA